MIIATYRVKFEETFEYSKVFESAEELKALFKKAESLGWSLIIDNIWELEDKEGI